MFIKDDNLALSHYLGTYSVQKEKSWLCLITFDVQKKSWFFPHNRYFSEVDKLALSHTVTFNVLKERLF
jgi:hypothetical protein